MKTKKIPERTCIGCMQVKPKSELIRVVKSSEGEISIDKTGKKAGRGAYICSDIECLKNALKSRRLEKSFSCKIDSDIYGELENELKNS